MTNNNTKYYTGVGSRSLPSSTLELIEKIAVVMARKGYTLRSGAADGADKAFQKGACSVAPHKTEIWLPWRGFNNTAYVYTPMAAANCFVITEREVVLAGELLIETGIMSWWDNCKQSVHRLHGRNVHQVCGKPVMQKFTRNPSKGSMWNYPNNPSLLSSVCIYAAPLTEGGDVKGGTRTAVEISKWYGVPTYNLLVDSEREKLLKLLNIEEEKIE